MNISSKAGLELYFEIIVLRCYDWGIEVRMMEFELLLESE